MSTLAAAAVYLCAGVASEPAPPAKALTPVAADSVPFTGTHATDLLVTPTGETQHVEFCADSPRTRYVDLRFLALRTNSASDKTPIFLANISQGNGANALLIESDAYRTGAVNDSDQFGLHLLVGNWTTPCLAYEFGAFIFDTFFYDRTWRAETLPGSSFNAPLRATVLFLPTLTPFLYADVYYKVYHRGLEANQRRRLVSEDWQWVDAIVGLRFHQISERYRILAAPVGAPMLVETYNTRNDIFGAQIGFEADRNIAEYVSLRAVAKYVIGVNWQEQELAGTPGASLLTTDAIRGEYEDTRFGHFGDLSLAAVAMLTPHIETSLGVTCLLFGDVKRAANTFDVGNLPNPTLQSGRDWLVLYGFQWTVKVDF